jgi:hypothetical protein
MRQTTLLAEVLEVLRDYRRRVNRIGAETFRLRGETHAAWEARRHRLDLVAELLERLVATDRPAAGAPLARVKLDRVLRELAHVPEVPLPPSADEPPDDGGAL